MADERALRYARELERDDERLARDIAEVSVLAVEVEAVRDRAAAIAELLTRLPSERDRARLALEAAEDDLARRRAEAGEAAAALARAEERGEDREALAAARRAAVRTRDAASMGEKRARRAREAVEAIERNAAAAEDEAPRLGERAAELSRRLATTGRLSRSGVAPPAPGLDGAREWAGRARAALFVARGGLESERERVVREANELYASVAGEPAYGSSVTRVRERLERA